MKDQHLWNSVNIAMGFETKPASEIVGRSGIRHKFVSLGMDEATKRILAVSDQIDPKMAALVHADCETNLADFRLLTIRPETFNIGRFTELVKTVADTNIIDLNHGMKSAETWFRNNPISKQSVSSISDLVPVLRSNGWAGFEALVPFISASVGSNISPYEQFLGLLKELARIDWSAFSDELAKEGKLDLNSLASQDGQVLDQQFGLCSMPLFDMTDKDWEDMLSGSNPENCRDVLKRLGVAQYFEPPADHAVLAVVDRGLNERMKVAGAVLKLPEIGHKLSDNEFLSTPSNLIEKLDQLSDAGYVVEGEYGFVVTEKGKELRSTVKFKPREGVFSKLLSRIGFTVNLNPHDLIK